MMRKVIPVFAIVLIGTLFTEARASPKAYIGLFKDNAVAVVDLANNKVLTTIQVPPGPEGVLVAPDGKKVYVSSSGASTVSVIDTATDKAVDAIEVGKDPQGMAITPDGKRLLVCVSDAGEVVSIDTGTNKVDGRVAVAKAHGLAMTPDGLTAYVGSQKPDSPALVVLDVGRLAETDKISLDKFPRGLRFTPDGKQLYFTVAASESVMILDPDTKTISEVKLGFSPHAIAFTPGGEDALVVVQGRNELAIVSAADNSVASVAVGKFPHWVAVTHDGGTAYVTNETSNDVSVVDLTGKRVTATFPVGNAPRKIAITPMASLHTDPAVSIENFAFVPATITVKPGVTVKWTNKDSVPHTVTGDDNLDSGNLGPGKTFTHKFSKAGKYEYHCDIHTYMHGTVVVK